MATLNHPNRIACFFATSGHSGVDRVAKNLLPGMAAAGYQIDLLKIENHGPSLAGAESSVRIFRLKARHVYSALPELVKYLRHERPAVLLSDKDRVNRTCILASSIARAKNRVAVRIGTTVSVNLASRGAIDRILQRNSMRFLYRGAETILMPSSGAADDLSNWTGIPRQRIAVVPSPVITPDFIRQSEENIEHPWFQPGQPPVILGVGELSTRKDFATLLRAFSRIHETTNCRLMILGRGRKQEALQAMAGKLGFADRFALPGFVSNPYPYMKRAKLFVLTSRWEGMPVALIEALALGTPVVSTDCPSGPREILDSGRCGPLVAIGDDEALAREMVGILNNPQRPETLQQAALPYQLENSVSRYLAAMGLPSHVMSTS